MPMYQRPPFWRVPHMRTDPEDEPRYFGRKKVSAGTPAGKELVRGDIIAKIDDYDARDLRHEDAQTLFKNAPRQIKLVVQRNVDGESARPGSTPMAPRSPIPNVTAAPYRTASPTPAAAWRGPESLPRSTPVPFAAHAPHPAHAALPTLPSYHDMLLSPVSARTDDTIDESIQSQPYRTTPLVLPGAKVRREPGPCESYLRHHPNPAMRAPPSHDYRDTLMRQKMVHKQFNSPINLYSEQNIANSIRQQTSPLPHKPAAYDPAKSETYRALHEDGLTDADGLQEVPTPVQTKVFTAPANKKPAPPPKQNLDAKSQEKQTTFVKSLHEEYIQQSNSFKRLMYNVLGDTEL